MTTWDRTKIGIEREYAVTGAPDLQDTSTPRRMVIRPRKVTVNQVYGTNLVRGAAIEGRQVRRDGDLAGSKMILAGLTKWFDATPPNWLNDILASEGLEWAADEIDPASHYCSTECTQHDAEAGASPATALSAADLAGQPRPDVAARARAAAEELPTVGRWARQTGDTKP